MSAMRGYIGGWILGVAALFALGCGKAGEVDELASKRQLQTGEQTALLTIALPEGVDVEQTGLVAGGSLMLRDRAAYVSTTGAQLALVNVGITGTEVGASVTSGPLTSHAPVFLRSSTTIHGSVVSGGAVTQQHGVTVLGTTTQHASLPAPTILTWEPPLAPTPAASQTVSPDGSLTLAPGSYGALTVYSRGRLRLRSGNYAFTNVQVEPQAIIEVTVTPSDGPLVLYADQVSVFRGDIVTTTAESTAESTLLVHRGTNTIRLERSANLAIVAPHATVELATGGAQYRGSLYAKGVHLEPDVRLTYVPFKYWAWILPPKPVVSCVFSAGRGTWTAVFGYQSRPNATVEIPAGTRNFLSPDPGPQFPPITRFSAGGVAEALWVPMPTSGVTWTIHGRAANASLASERCEFGTDGPATAEVRGEGRPLPRSSIPSVPAPRRQIVAFQNASGPGRFQASFGPGPLTPPGVTDPIVPPGGGTPPDVPDGYATNPTVPLTLRVDTELPGDSASESDDLHAWSTIGGVSFGDVDLDEQNHHASYSVTAEVPRGSQVPVTFNEVEYNNFSDHEVFKLELDVNLATGHIGGAQRSGKLDKSWAFPLPLTIENYVQLSWLRVSAQVESVNTFHFHGGNTAHWSIRLPPEPPGTTRVCANWTGYFVDEGLPSPDGVTETFQGVALDGGLRVRGYRAAFASYELAVRGAVASFKQSGRLDVNGCIPNVPTAALVYRNSLLPGGLGGIDLYLKIRADMTVPVEGGVAEFPVFDGDGGPHVEAALHVRAFDDDGGWPLHDGYRIPPAEVVLTKPYRDHGTTVAATISHSVRRLIQEGVALPARQYPTIVGDGESFDTKDYQGNLIPDSYYQAGVLHIGPAFIPCYPSPKPGQPCTTGPKECTSDEECAGGQHCAKVTDAADGCAGGECYCAYADQGTSKYVTTHELGHMIQEALAGTFGGGGGEYVFDCPKYPGTDECIEHFGLPGKHDDGTTALVDPPLMHEVCGCQHVKAANAYHCLQSIERAARADGEGFAQFFASLMWNESTGSCRFNYYKEVLDVDQGCRVSPDDDPEACTTFTLRDGSSAAVTLPPVPIDCRAPAKWRNRNACTVNEDLGSTLRKKTMGTEYDWMTFLFAVNSTFGFNELMNIYKHACRPAYDGPLEGLNGLACGESNSAAGVTASIAWAVEPSDVRCLPDGRRLLEAQN